MAHADARQVLSLHCAGRRQPTSAIPSAFSSSVGPSDAAAAGAAAAAAGWDISPAQGAPPSRSSMIQKSESLLKMTRMRILTVCALRHFESTNEVLIGGRACVPLLRRVTRVRAATVRSSGHRAWLRILDVHTATRRFTRLPPPHPPPTHHHHHDTVEC